MKMGVRMVFSHAGDLRGGYFFFAGADAFVWGDAETDAAAPLEVTGALLAGNGAAGARVAAGCVGSGSVHSGPPEGPTGMGVRGMAGGVEPPQPSAVSAASATVESCLGIGGGDSGFKLRILS
jgi:hypothetical protein